MNTQGDGQLSDLFLSLGEVITVLDRTTKTSKRILMFFCIDLADNCIQKVNLGRYIVGCMSEILFYGDASAEP